MTRATKKKTEKTKASKRPKAGAKKLPFHAFWSGSLSFGLVNVPVLVFPASRHSGVRLRLLGPQGAPLERRYYCPAHNKALNADEIVRGYELDDGSTIIVEDRELEAVEPEKTREIALREFVDLAKLPPAMLERGYYLTPQRDANKAYCLLAETMERTRRAGIATFVMRDREYLVAIFAQNGILCAETLRFVDELRDPESLGLPKATSAPRQRVAAFERAIDALAARTIPNEELADRDTHKLKAIITKKAKARKDLIQTKRETRQVDSEDEDVEDVDLLETIRRSLRQVGHRSAIREEDVTAGSDEAPARRGRRGTTTAGKKRSSGGKRLATKQRIAKAAPARAKSR